MPFCLFLIVYSVHFFESFKAFLTLCTYCTLENLRALFLSCLEKLADDSFQTSFYSLQSTLKTSNGVHVYTCADGMWVLIGGVGDLLDFNTDKHVGNYSFVRKSRHTTFYWTLLNSDGDAAESGFLASIVTGFFPFPSITIKSQIAGGICLRDIVRNADIACICERIGTWNLCQTNFHHAKSMEIVNGASFPNFAPIFKVEEQVFNFMTIVL